MSARARPARGRLLVAGLPALLLAFLLSACGSEDSAEADDDRIDVIATTNWHADLARQIGGDRVRVEGLMGPGVDPHLYQATAGDVQRLSGADVAIWNGLELEGKMEEVFGQVGRRVPVVTVGEAVPEEDLIPIEGSKEFDPHVWFDPDAWRLGADAVADALIEVDPAGEGDYRENLAQFERELEETDAEVRELLASIPARSRVLVTSHDAFSYFARSYDLEVAPIQGKSTASEATTADIERVAARIADAELGAVFIESSVPRQTINAVLGAAEQRGQRTKVGGELLGDALGSPGSDRADWRGAMIYNAETIAAGLGK